MTSALIENETIADPLQRQGNWTKFIDWAGQNNFTSSYSKANFEELKRLDEPPMSWLRENKWKILTTELLSKESAARRDVKSNNLISYEVEVAGNLTHVSR